MEEDWWKESFLQDGSSPSEIALTKIVNARMKMINDALPNTVINLLTACCPIKAATVATAVKKRAAIQEAPDLSVHALI